MGKALRQNRKLYTISDGKPIHYVHRSVYESICNLPTFSSVAEIGFGNGKHLVNLNYLLGPDINFHGFDISQKQINLFHETFIEEGASIGSGSTILCGIKIGKGSIIGAGSLVSKNIPDGKTAYGNPALVK